MIARLSRWMRPLVLLGGALCLLGPPGVIHAANPADGSLSVRPIAGVPPATIVDLSTTPVVVEGQLRLDWTAPTVFAGSTLDTYQIRIQTFTLASVGGSTTTWWNAAGGFTAQGFYGESPGAAVARTVGPTGSGSDHTIALFPGNTYYISVRSADDVGTSIDLWSDISAVVQASPIDSIPTTPVGVSATGTLTSVNLTWTDLTAVQKGPDFDAYQIYRSTQSGTGYALLSTTTAASYSDTSVLLGTTYYYQITALDIGPPGSALESPLSTEVSGERLIILATPLRPNGFTGSSAGGVLTFSWRPVTLDTTGQPIAIANYNIYRYDAIESTPTLVGQPVASTYSEAVGGLTYFYRVVAMAAGNSPSAASDYIDSTTDVNRIAIASGDPQSRITLPMSVAVELNAPNNGSSDDYEVVAVRQMQNENTITLKSYDFKVQNARTGQVLPNFAFTQAVAEVQVSYGLSLPTLGLTSGVGGQSTVTQAQAIAQLISLYWHNGAGFIRVGGTVLVANQALTISAKNLGLYEVRAVSMPSSFALTRNSPYPRVITPNHPTQNNRVFWFFDNPTLESVAGTIYDVRGAKVRELIVDSLSPTPNSLVWDGRDMNGAVVPSGVYLYKIQAGKESATGSIVVAR